MSSEQAIGPGQWIGQTWSDSVPDGWLTISIEADRPEAGFACIQQGDPVPPWRVPVMWEKDGSSIIGKSFGKPLAFDDKVGRLVPRENHSNRESCDLPDNIGFIAIADGSTISGDWIAQPGTHGTFRVENTLGVETTATKMSWPEVKGEIAKRISTGQPELWFRGQSSNSWQLNTSFHRLHRYDLFRFCEEAMEPLRREIGSRIGRRFDLANSEELGALLSIAQHHGFPTPLLDWTASPYIAAYFAVAGKIADGDARLFFFDIDKWRQLKQPKSLTNPAPAISACEFEPYDNPRHLPQQSRHILSNVADIEGFMHIVGRQKNIEYLQRIDIPASERQSALKDLRYMGITAATLFPGLDGACKALRERLFGCP